jgi:hypothetical protein
MDGSRAQIGVDSFDTYAPVIGYSTALLLISPAFGNKWEMFHWDISVAFTNAKADEETYARFPNTFPEGLFPGYKGSAIVEFVWQQISTDRSCGTSAYMKLLMNVDSNQLLVIHVCFYALPTW